jgi:hypothetical protein
MKMQNDLKYQVRSREIGDLVSMLRSGRLIISPYFQRNLVWRDAHKHDFIDTILQGLPIPQVFLARGAIDLQRMESFTCVVDGQQRLNAIREFTADRFPVHGKLFSELSNDEKTSFIKYEVPVIDFDLDAGDVRLKDVFKRLNRTFYSLSIIERIATEYSSSEFLLTARVLCGDIAVAGAEEDEIEALDVLVKGLAPEDGSDPGGAPNEFLRDPGVSEEKWASLQERAGGAFSRLLVEKNVFSSYEFQRKTPLMFVLNVMATITGGYYSRNDKVKFYLDDNSAEYPESDQMIAALNRVADKVFEMELGTRSIWFNKANFFTMVCELALDDQLDKLAIQATTEQLSEFERNPPREFVIAAREAVNNRPERVLRANMFRGLIRH